MDENPYQTPSGEPFVSVASPPAGCRGVRLSVFFLNCFLLVLFPPTCCPCGFGPIGFLPIPIQTPVWNNGGRRNSVRHENRSGHCITS